MATAENDPPESWANADLAHWHAYARSRSDRLRAQLVERYIDFARITAARLFQRRIDNSVQFADFLQYARIGLVEAIDHYDPAREVPFEAFASYRIAGAVLNGLESETEVAAQRAYWSRRARERLRSLKQQSDAVNQRPSRKESNNLTIGVALRYLTDHDNGEVADETATANPYALIELNQLKHAVRALLPGLPRREEELLRRHYVDGIEFQQIAADWGVTKGRVSQLHSRALRRLREMFHEQHPLDPPE